MTISAMVTVIFVLAYYVCALWRVRGIHITTKDLCIAGVVVAMTVVLEAVRVPLPTGASIPLLSPVPLLLLALLWNDKLAILSGWVCGVVVTFFIPGWQAVHWAQFFVEQLLCFSCLGFAGVFGNDTRRKTLCGIVLASFLKVAGHITSGVLFFSQNAWDGWSAWAYSFTYHLSGNVPLCILCGIVVLLMPLHTIRHAIKGGTR